MKYLCLIYNDEREMGTAPRPATDKMMAEYWQFTEDIKKSGHYKGGDPLQPTSKAATVRVRGGKTVTTDGPFAETREQLGGFYLIDAKDLDEAIAVASKIPGAKKGTVEIRPVLEIPGLPNASSSTLAEANA